VTPALLLLIVVAPSAMALLSNNGPLAWYVSDAAVCAVLLHLYGRDKPWRTQCVCWIGVAVHVLAAAYGLASEAGAVPEDVLWWVLAGFAVVAELLARSQRGAQ